MAQLPLNTGIPRFKQNEERMDRFTNGSDNQTFTTSGGIDVPTIRKFLKDKDAEIDSNVEQMFEDAATGLIASVTNEANRSRDEADRSEAARDIAAGYASDAVSQGNVPIYAAVMGMPALTIPTGINAIRVNGYYAVGDGGGGFYVKTDGEPSHPGKFQTSDGAWWQLIEKDSITPLHFGAVAAAGTDSSAAFAAMVKYSELFGVGMKLPGGGRVYEKSGRTLVHNNFHLEICKGATLKRTGSDGYIFINGDGTRGGGYSGCKNVTIVVNGVVDCGRVGTTITTAFWVGAHQDGLHVKGTGEITNSYGSHVMEINSTRRALVENIGITNRLFPASGNYEAVQIDYSNNVGYPAHGPYDDTPCEDITIRNVYFDGGQSGVGSHSTPPTPHKNIRVIQCTFNAPTGYAIRPQRWKDSFALFNTIISAGTRGILSWACDNTVFAYNNVLGGCSDFGIQISWDGAINPTNVRAIQNSVIGVSGVGIYISNGSGHVAEDNVINDAGQEAINVSSTTVTNVFVGRNKVTGASASNNGAYSAIRITGGGCSVKTNTVKRSGAANTYSYGIYFPTGSQSNTCDGNDVQAGTSGDIGDQSALTSLNSINGRVLLFNGNVSSGTITLAADITLFAALEVQTGAVGTGFFSSGRAVPFNTTRRWNVGSDHVTVKTIQGKVDCTIPTSNTLTIVTANDAVRSIYGLAA